MNSKKNSFRPMRRIAGIFLSLATAVTAYAGLGAVDRSPVTTEVSAAAADYGLMDTCQEGVILHAWQWSFNNIKDNMKQIAEAGYTSIQTSVIQQSKEGTKGKTNSVWWVYYQPAQFCIDDTGNSALGNKAEFAAMCAEAHKYGIHVIVDVVANHLANQSKYDISSAVPSDIRNDSSCWHSDGFTEIDYNSRYSITHGSMGGLPDLNTESSKIQNYVITYLKECIDAGADGFRFDAAKHISVPSEGSEYTFWPNVINAAKSYYTDHGYYDALYCYGEVLGGLSGSATVADYNRYMAVTDDSTGNNIRKNINNGAAAAAATPSYDKGVSADNLVLWAESHDTYSGDEKISTNISTSVINKTWALVASRNKASALYFARTKGYRTGNIGDIDSTECFKPEVVEVNKFHNRFNGQTEYLSSSNNIAYNERGTDGVVLVNVTGGSIQVSVTAHKMADGTYTDHISGNTFTVANGKINGTIGSTGIAVVYDSSSPKFTVSPDNGASFEDTISVKLTADNLTACTYSTSEGVSDKAFTSGDTITIGAKTTAGQKVTLTLKGTDADGKAFSQTYQYYKLNPDDYAMVYFDNSSYNWSKVYVYAYAPSGTTVIKNAAWPGIAMTYNPEKKLYEWEPADELLNGYVIFTESSSATTNRYPADGEQGMPLNGVSMVFGANHSWTEYHEDVQPLTNHSTVSADTVTAGSSIAVNCASEGGSGTVQYSVLYKPYSAFSWTTAQSYSNNQKVTLKLSYACPYTVCIKAKDSTGTMVSKIVTVTATAKNSTLTNRSKSNYMRAAIGDTFTITCASGGGSGTVQYHVAYRLVSSETWHTLQNYSTKKSVVFKPAYSAPYYIRVKAKDSAGHIATTLIRVNGTAAGSTLTNSSKLSAESIAAGQSVTVSCAAKDGSGTMQYQVQYKQTSSVAWTTAQAYSTNSKVSVKLTSAAPYHIRVTVKDGTGNTAAVALPVTVTANANSTLTNTSALSANTVTAGTAVTVNCASKGGSGTMNYAVSYRLSTDKTYTTLQAYSTNTKVSLPITKSGKYVIQVSARDAAGAVAVKSITLTVK